MAPGIWGEHLRVGLLTAIEQVYDENCQRFAPEDIGDNNKTFGITVSENLYYVIERDVVPLIEGAGSKSRGTLGFTAPRQSVASYLQGTAGGAGCS